MPTLTYTILGVHELSLNLDARKKRYVPLIRAKLVTEIAKEIQARAPKWTGELRDSVVEDITGGVVHVESLYATFVEYGTQAGYFPNIGNITPWAEGHGIPAGALATSIERKGTKAHPFVAPAVEAVETRAIQIAEEVWTQLGVI